MIFTAAAIDGIKAGRITLALRRWNQVGIKPGSLIRSSLGVVEIVSVDEVAEFSDRDAVAAGFGDADEATRVVDKRSRGGQRYRIGVRFVGADPRGALRERAELTESELADVRRRLTRMDRDDPWARAYLELIAAHPGVVSTTLAAQVGVDRQPFKLRVRRLKELGLTESLEVGYRISPRGRAVLDAMR